MERWILYVEPLPRQEARAVSGFSVLFTLTKRVNNGVDTSCVSEKAPVFSTSRCGPLHKHKCRVQTAEHTNEHLPLFKLPL